MWIKFDKRYILSVLEIEKIVCKCWGWFFRGDMWICLKIWKGGVFEI